MKTDMKNEIKSLRESLHKANEMSRLEYRNLKEKEEQAIEQLKRSMGAKIAKINTEMKVIEKDLNNKNIENSSLKNDVSKLEDLKSQMDSDLNSLRTSLQQTEKKYIKVQHELCITTYKLRNQPCFKDVNATES